MTYDPLYVRFHQKNTKEEKDWVAIDLKLHPLFPIHLFKSNLISNINKIEFHKVANDMHLKCLSGIHINEIVLTKTRFITDKGMSYIDNINIIILDDVPITDASMFYLRNTTKITLKHMHSITSRGLRYLNMIKSISLINCSNITNDGLKYLSAVEIFEMAYCPKITDYGLAYLFPKCQIKLRGVNSKSFMGTGTEISFVAVKLNEHQIRRLSAFTKSLFFRDCKMSNKIIAYLSNQQEISLSYCGKITHRSLQYLSHIPSVHISYCYYFEDNKSIIVDLERTNDDYHYSFERCSPEQSEWYDN